MDQRYFNLLDQIFIEIYHDVPSDLVKIIASYLRFPVRNHAAELELPNPFTRSHDSAVFCRGNIIHVGLDVAYQIERTMDKKVSFSDEKLSFSDKKLNSPGVKRARIDIFIDDHICVGNYINHIPAQISIKCLTRPSSDVTSVCKYHILAPIKNGEFLVCWKENTRWQIGNTDGYDCSNGEISQYKVCPLITNPKLLIGQKPSNKPWRPCVQIYQDFIYFASKYRLFKFQYIDDKLVLLSYIKTVVPTKPWELRGGQCAVLMDNSHNLMWFSCGIIQYINNDFIKKHSQNPRCRKAKITQYNGKLLKCFALYNNNNRYLVEIHNTNVMWTINEMITRKEFVVDMIIPDENSVIVAEHNQKIWRIDRIGIGCVGAHEFKSPDLKLTMSQDGNIFIYENDISHPIINNPHCVLNGKIIGELDNGTIITQDSRLHVYA